MPKAKGEGGTKAPTRTKVKAPAKPAEVKPVEWKPIKSRVRSIPSTGRTRTLRVRFPKARLPRVMNAGELRGSFGDLLRETFQARTANSELSTPEGRLVGRSVRVSKEVADEVVSWEKEGGDLDRLVYAALVRRLKL